MHVSTWCVLIGMLSCLCGETPRLLRTSIAALKLSWKAASINGTWSDCSGLEQIIICRSTASMEFKSKGLADSPFPGSVTEDDAPQMQPARNDPKFLLKTFFLPMLPFDKSASGAGGEANKELHRDYIFLPLHTQDEILQSCQDPVLILL